MCKFNNRLFVFALYCLLGLVSVWAKPVQLLARSSADDLGALVALSALMNSQDIHYDQRQKGDENYRIKLDGFFIGLPQEESTALLLLTEDVFENLDDDKLLAFGKNKPTATASSSADLNTAITSTATGISPVISDINQSLSSNSDFTGNKNISPPLIVEIPASKKFVESRNSVDSTSRTKSFVSHFLNFLKKTRKH